MKRYISFCTILFAILFASCNNSVEGLDPAEALYVSTGDIEMECIGGEQTVQVNSYCSWQIESTEKWEWITASKTKGNKGNSNIKFVLSENKTVENRTAVITIKNTKYNLKHEIAVLQKEGKPFLNTSKDNIATTANGINDTITVESNLDYTITSSQEWCKVSPVKSEAGIKKINVDIKPNTTTVERTAVITFKNTEYNITKEIAVSQEKFEPVIEIVGETNIEMPVEGGRKDFTLESNINWNVTCEASWVRISPINGNSDTNTLTVTIENNTGTEARDTKILISNTEYDVTKEITVSQKNFEPAIEVGGETNIEMPAEGGTKDFTLESNINWNATCEASWVRISPVNGNPGTNTLTVTIDNNTGTEARNTRILISNNEYNISKEITVNQSNFDAILDVSNTTVSANGDGDTKSVTVSSSIDWVASSNAEWITFSPANGSKGNTTLGITIANNESTTPRVDSVIVFNSQYNISKAIRVNQAAFVPAITSIAGTSFTVEYMSGTKFISIDANVEYTASSDADWLSVEKVRDGINVKYMTNRNDSNSRTANILISSVNYEDISIELSVTQLGYSSNNVIRYTCTSGMISPNVQTGFGANIIGIGVENGVGEIVFDAEVTSIADNAFSNCSQLTSITIPSSVTTIGNNAFKNCSALNNIDLPSEVTSIGSAAFSSCTALTDITLPEDLSSISSELFYGCSSLTTVEVPSSITSIGSHAFQNCNALENIEIPEGVTTIDSYAFSNCSALESIEIPEGLSSIGSYAFQNCNALESIEMPVGLSSIGSYAFSNCSAVVSVEIPEGVTSIGSYAFNNCSALEEVEIPEGVTTINERLFNGCTSLKNVELPSTVTAIGSYAFNNCSALESIDLPLEVTSIGQYAFYNCSKINYVCIPSKVSSIGQYAFYNCSSLSVVVCTGKTPATGGSNMFGYNANGRNIFVPVGCSSTYRSYSYWSNYSSSIYDIEYTPTECTSLSIVAEDVDANATYTTITYTAITNGSTPYGYVSNIEMTGRVQSTSFPANTSKEDIERTVSYTYMGQTATTTITHFGIRGEYTINLNYAWRKSTSVSNPDPSLYDGVYESYSNYGYNSSTATMYINIEGYDSFRFYVRSDGESGCDYVTVSHLDSSNIKISTSRNSGTSLSSYTLVEYTNIGRGSHRITITYRKDYSVSSGTDRGYILIPKDQ